MKTSSPHNQIPFNTTNAVNIQMPDYLENPGPLPAPYPKNKSGGGKGPLGRPDFCSKDPELVTRLQMMPVTPGCNPGIYGPDKGGVDWAFGSFTKAAVNYFQVKKRDQKQLIGHLEVK